MSESRELKQFEFWRHADTDRKVRSPITHIFFSPSWKGIFKGLLKGSCKYFKNDKAKDIDTVARMLLSLSKLDNQFGLQRSLSLKNLEIFQLRHYPLYLIFFKPRARSGDPLIYPTMQCYFTKSKTSFFQREVKIWENTDFPQACLEKLWAYLRGDFVWLIVWAGETVIIEKSMPICTMVCEALTSYWGVNGRIEKIRDGFIFKLKTLYYFPHCYTIW